MLLRFFLSLLFGSFTFSLSTQRTSTRVILIDLCHSSHPSKMRMLYFFFGVMAILVIYTSTSVYGISLPTLKSQLQDKTLTPAAQDHPLSNVLLEGSFIPLQQLQHGAQEEEEFFDRLEEHHELLDQGMTMQIELGETAVAAANANAEANSHLVSYKFGNLRGSAIVDAATGLVKEYSLPLKDINNSQYIGRIQVRLSYMQWITLSRSQHCHLNVDKDQTINLTSSL